MTVFCKDCKFCQRSWVAITDADALAEARCTAYRHLNLVTGREIYDPCSIARGIGQCGREGKLFVAKDASLRDQLTKSLEATVEAAVNAH